jgi:hypothetical protein
MTIPGNLHWVLREGYYTRIINGMEIALEPRCTNGGLITKTRDGWQLDIPAGKASTYRLAQLDDYVILTRRSFHHAPPWRIFLQAKISATNLPGTWGFGLWNDPFGFSLGFGRTEGRLPVLPNAAWFFHASPPNWLSFRDGIPARGFFVGSIRSPRLPSLILAPAIVALPFLAIRPISRLIRKLTAKIVEQEANEVSIDPTQFHEYSIEWLRECVIYKVDTKTIIKTNVSPFPPMGLVIWIDNQFAAWNPGGHLSYGTLENPAASLEIKSIKLGI